MEVVPTSRCGVPFYRCDAFPSAVAAHGFSTRLGGVSPPPWDSLNLGAARGDGEEKVAENFFRFCLAVGADPHRLYKNHQIHGDRIRSVCRGDPPDPPGQPGRHQADGLITDVPGTCLVAFSADCIPVLLLDPVRRVAAAVHAGWRGTALGIAARAAGQMQQDYGCRPGDILAAIGPGISACCFETHRDVPDGLRAGLGDEAAPLIRPGSEPGKFLVDLKGANRRWLLRAGLRPDHIALCPACTACSPDIFWSHRRMGEARGTMAAVIQLL